MSQIATERPPVCPCCGGDGMHGYRAYARGASDRDDWEGCTTCRESGRSWHTDVRPDSCGGAYDLARRTHQQY